MPPPRTQSSPEGLSSTMMCEDVVAMPCLSGRTCMVEEGRSCQVCKCLGPNIAPIDHPWMATEDPLLQGGPIGGPEPH